MMASSCASLFGNLLVFCAMVMSFVSLGTPYWLRSAANETQIFNLGLWQYCIDDNCTITVGNTNADVPKWFEVMRVVYAAAAAVTALSFLSSCCYMCCKCCRSTLKAVQLTVILLVISCIIVALTVLLTVVPPSTSFIPYHGQVVLGWSYWVAVATGGALFLGIVMLVCATSNTKSPRAGYQTIEPTSQYA